MNLYLVWDKQYEWCCYVFAVSRNQAKLMVAELFSQEYIDMRCKTLRKGLCNPQEPATVDYTDDYLYEIVKQCGYEYTEEEG